MSKRILLISDTHGFHENLRKVVKAEQPFERALHMGDMEGCEAAVREIVGVPVTVVSGNSDWESGFPSEKTLRIGGVNIFMTHGHEYYVTTGMELLFDRVASCGCQVALFGHTHQPFLQYYGGVLVANPGSISRPRQPGHLPSYGILTITDEGQPEIELKFCNSSA